MHGSRIFSAVWNCSSNMYVCFVPNSTPDNVTSGYPPQGPCPICSVSHSCLPDNACLSVYYLLVVRYGVAETTLVYVEPLFHLIPITFGISTSVAGLALDLFNNANVWCWIAPLPAGCEDSRTYGETTCTRGDNAWIYR
jgi:hypothetical protein